MQVKAMTDKELKGEIDRIASILSTGEPFGTQPYSRSRGAALLREAGRRLTWASHRKPDTLDELKSYPCPQCGKEITNTSRASHFMMCEAIEPESF